MIITKISNKNPIQYSNPTNIVQPSYFLLIFLDVIPNVDSVNT